jgi:hypothetical protein
MWSPNLFMYYIVFAEAAQPKVTGTTESGASNTGDYCMWAILHQLHDRFQGFQKSNHAYKLYNHLKKTTQLQQWPMGRKARLDSQQRDRK